MTTRAIACSNECLFPFRFFFAVREEQGRLHAVLGAHGDRLDTRRRTHAAWLHPPHTVSTVHFKLVGILHLHALTLILLTSFANLIIYLFYFI